MLEIRPATPADVAGLTPYVPNWPLGADAQPVVHAAWAFVALLDGQVVAGGGMDRLWSGVAQCWLVVVPGARTWCARSLARAMRHRLRSLIDRHRLWRVEANVHTALEQAVRLTEWLGFRRECTKAHWGPDGKDYHHYSLITERYLP